MIICLCNIQLLLNHSELIKSLLKRWKRFNELSISDDERNWESSYMVSVLSEL